MRTRKSVVKFIAMLLAVAMMLTACQVPEGTEIPEGLTSVSISSEDANISEDAGAKGSQEASTEDLEDLDEIQEESPCEENISDQDAPLIYPYDDAEEEKAATEPAKTAVVLPSGRTWVQYVLDVEEYKSAHADLQTAFGDDWDAYVDHWLTTGVYEGRTQGVLFDPFAYADAYEDVKAECGRDVNKIIEHYIAHGLNENRPIGTTQGYEDMADKISREEMVGEAIDRTPSTRIDALLAVADNVFRYGRNQEGALYPQLIVDGIDPVTKEAVIWNKFTSDKSWVSNLYGQSNLLKMLEGLTMITGDPKYQDLAYDQIRIRYNTPGLVDSNGLFYAGGHTVTDIMTGKQSFLYHETKDYQLPVDMYYRVDPEAFKRYVTAFWNAHVYDPSSLIMNRHGYYDAPMANGDFWSSEYTNTDPWVESWTAPFISTGNDMMELAYYLTYATGDQIYRQWADDLLDKYLAVSNPKTGLLAGVYGIMVEDAGDGTSTRDRWLYNFIGADFVDASGVDYKTLTEWDSRIVGETVYCNRDGTKATQGYGTQTYIYLYELTGSEKFYNMAKENMLGFVRFMYDPTRHRLVTPIGNDGTDFNPGEGNGPILIAPRGGYYLYEGKSFPESETVHDLVFKSMVDMVDMLEEKDRADAEEIWAATRAWGMSSGLGDIGTYLGENVNVNLNTNSNSPMITLGVLSLYKHTGHQQYYDLAVKLADNILMAAYDEEIGLFGSKNAPYIKFDTEPMYAVFCVEAMTRGILDQISLDISHSGPDYAHDGRGQVSDGAVFYNRAKVNVKKVEFGSDTYSLILDQVPDIEIRDVYGHADEKAIRQMVSLGLLEVDAEGNFNPDATVTYEELAAIVVEAFGLENRAALDAILGQVPFATDRIVTREEMAYVLVKALQNALPEKEFYIANALYRITDADTISDWARDYADIATNCRLMVDIEEDVFMPKADVTKAMVADALQNIYRYIPVTGVQKLNAVITPYNADSQIITWETSDATILEIDAQGRMYPLKEGTVTITATADEEYAEIEVTVAEQEDWMIKEIRLGEEPLDNFNSTIFDYDVNLYLGTTQAPVITGTSFSGAPVEVSLPDSLPGRAEVWVQGTTHKYTIDMDNTYVKTIFEENFNHKIGTEIQYLKSEGYNWFINGTSVNYNENWKVIPKNWVRPDYEGYGCWNFPYRHDKPGEAGACLELNENEAIFFGPEQDDMLVVIELEIACKNLQDKHNGFYLKFGESILTGNSAFASFIINDKGEIVRRIDRTTLSKATRRKMNEEQFYKMTLILNKKDGSFDYYLDDELIEKNVPAFHNFCPGFGGIGFGVYTEDEYCNAELFYDNFKVYELQRSVVEERYAQELAPATPKPTYIPLILEENFDDFKLDTWASNLESDNWTALWALSYNHDHATVVSSKNSYNPNASDTDRTIEFRTGTDMDQYKYGLPLYMQIPDSRWYNFTEIVDGNKYVVVEMDLALTGTDGLTAADGYQIRIGGEGNFALANFRLYAGHLARNIDSTHLTEANEKNVYYKGDIAHLTWVMDKETKRYTYFWNGTMVEEDVLAQFPGEDQTPCIKYISFITPMMDLPYGVESFDEKFYIDNIKIYETGSMLTPTPGPTRDPNAPTPVPTAPPTPVPTPEPTGTPKPTYTPVILDVDFDDVESGSQARYLRGEFWKGQWGHSYNHDKGLILAKKDTVDANAPETDNLLRLQNATSLDQYKYGGSLYFQIGDERWYPLGTADCENKYTVLEVDMALTGDGSVTNTNGYPLRIGGDGNFALTNFKLFATHLGRHVDSRTVTELRADGKNAYTPGEIGHLKWVLNKETKRYTYYWNGVLVEENVLAQFSGPETSAIKYLLFAADAVTLPDGVDTCEEAFHIDNIKLYETNEVGVPTPAPTAAPTAEPTPAPTETPGEPTAAPTEAPTEGPTTEPTAEPTYNPVIIDMNYDHVALGTQARYLSGQYWTTAWGHSYNQDLGTVASKKDTIGPGADATDFVLKMENATNLHERQYGASLYMNVAEEKWIPLGNAENELKYMVLEMDLALTADANVTNTKGYPIRIGGDGNFGLTNFKLFATHLGRHVDSRTVTELRADGKNAYTPGEVGHLKWVLDKETKRYTYYWNGVLVEENVLAQFSGPETSAIKYILIAADAVTLPDGVQTCNEIFYVDNIKLYESNEDAEPTPAPSEAPTEAPSIEPSAQPTAEPTAEPTELPADLVINENYNSYAVDSLLVNTGATGYSWTFSPAAAQQAAVIVAKNTINASADANDYCVKMPCSTASDYYFALQISEEEAYALGNTAPAGSNLVIEMDVALAGIGSKPAGYKFYYSQLLSGGTQSVARFLMTDTNMARHVSSAVLNDEGVRPAVTKGEFANFKVVIDRQSKKYSYYWNGNLVESTGLGCIHSGTPEIGMIQFQAFKEAEEQDIALYIDNLKVYVEN